MFPTNSMVDMRAHLKDLEPVSIIAEAENRSNTRAYQTESGETKIAPLSIPGGLIMTRSMTAMEWFCRKWIAIKLSKLAAHPCAWCVGSPDN